MGVELWDCSGHQRFEPCWPAMMQNADAVVLIYNPACVCLCIFVSWEAVWTVSHGCRSCCLEEPKHREQKTAGGRPEPCYAYQDAR